MPDLAMRDTLTALFERRMGDLSQQLADGSIDLGEWQIQMRQELRDVHALQLIAAADGNKANVSSDDWLKLGSELQKQYRYLEDFAQGIHDGSVSPDAIASRAELYAGSGKSTFWRQATGADLPAYPGDGSSPCLGRCDCEWVDNGDGSFTWKDTGHGCPTCRWRGEHWAPYWPEEEKSKTPIILEAA